MKFSLKLLLWMIVVMAAALGISGFYFVNSVFHMAMEREIGQAMEEGSILRFAFETAALNAPSRYDVLSDHSVGQIAGNLELGSRGRLLRISGEQMQPLYESSGFACPGSLVPVTDSTKNTYQVIDAGGAYYIQTCAVMKPLDRTLYLETMRDVSGVFRERALGFAVYRRVMAVMLLLGALVMHGISSWLTRPIRLLTRAAKRMTEGDYHYRAKKVSEDELGQLTINFNRMANSLEENIHQLEEEIQAREEFVAAFAHELKTPLTAIIGYADMLRSQRLDEEKQYLSANYIYTEGKRLETMAFRLLEIIVTKKSEIRLRTVAASAFFQYLSAMYQANKEVNLVFSFEEGMVDAEPALIQSVLLNLTDNARKASPSGGRIEISGRNDSDGYRFSVKDYGVGIPEQEQQKITQAFYMVDKSRSRSQNGAGLGLALCAEVLALHHSRLEIESTPGKGTCVGFLLPKNNGSTENGGGHGK